MRILFLLFLSVFSAFSFELVVNSGREENEPFAILHTKNDDEFSCMQKIDAAKVFFECEIPGVVSNELKNQNFALFDIKFQKEEQKIRMFIFPKTSAKMFNLSQNIYKDKELSALNSHHSKQFTFVFSHQVMTNNIYDGLDFDIIFPHESLPFVGALDLNSDPVVIPQSADINTYLRIKNEFEKGNFTQVITDAQNAIMRYKGSIFMSEFILYKLRAQSELYTQNPSIRDQQILEKMIDEIKNYTRTFTSDKNYAEILHIMLKTYIALSQRKDVDYTMSILENELPKNDFTQLSRLEYADYIYHLNEVDRAIKIYEDIYFNTDNLNLASRAAMALAKDFLANNNAFKAKEFINTILKANPSYFGEDITRSLELAKLFYAMKDYDLSSQIYTHTFSKMPRIDERYEETLKNLSLALAQNSKAIEAKKYIDLYLNEYYDGKYLDEIKKASDEVFFAVGDDNATLLHTRYKDLMKEYEAKDKNIANKALDEDVKLYFKEKDYPAILAYKNAVEASKLTNATKLLEMAAVEELKAELKKDECIKAVKIFTEFSAYEIGQKIDNKKQMLACLQRTSNINQALDYIDKNAHEDSIFYHLQKAKIYFDSKKYTQSIALTKDISNSRVLKSEEEEFSAYYLQFVSLLRLNHYNEAIKILQILESFPMNFTMVEAYDELISFAKDKGMITTILTYAPKAIDYQNFKGINLFSPNLEFVYLDALQKNAQYDKALELLKDLIKLKLSPSDKARVLYARSQIYEKLNNINAQKQSLKECLEVNGESNWQNLCREKNALLKN
ncbi:DUF7494 domain-containing protein [Campylobacter helveticus]|uniref:Flagellar protein n=1 Tax=Campylobacter helveticus TaxID=28898 RepID=A0AAX2ULG5_9BACT|nr:flagellar protein [Campylobacter helveticus]ARE81079.1 paralysed flagella protein A [Campylobacter helveticus]MCR2054098.1 flagellar protein [Campylobacter helveticus]MCR2059961.1 flagellar protein [Campylobacter helveticus]QBL12433.1 flagellar protein [Campylobacter helveticus]TNB56975.1 flagellar protein [Campylobacter helveticus]